MNNKKNIEPKCYFPLEEGHFLPLTNDRLFRAFCRDKGSRRFLCKIISFITGLSYELLLEKMVIADSKIPEDRVNNHYNDQDIILNVDNMTLNLEMCTNIHKNQRKNEITAHKIRGNQYKMGEKYEDVDYLFYQICFETYNLFNNNLLVNEVNLVNVSSGNHEVESTEFKKFHVNLSDTTKVCYNSFEEENYFYFFGETNIEKLKNKAKGDEILMEVFNTLENIHNDSLLMSELESKEIEEYCNRRAMSEEKKESFNEGFDEGKSVGFEDGKSVGFESGKNVGFNEGKKENQVEIAKKMLAKGSDIDFIIECTGLTREELENLN